MTGLKDYEVDVDLRKPPHPWPLSTSNVLGIGPFCINIE
jgi:hypothetical protein